MVNIIKKEVVIKESLKKKIEFICDKDEMDEITEEFYKTKKEKDDGFER